MIAETKTISLVYKPKHILSSSNTPCYATLCSAGADVFADIESPIVLNEGAITKIPTGCYLDTSNNKWTKFVMVAPKSGLIHNHGIEAKLGIVDLDYPGEIMVTCEAKQCTTIFPGMKIAQLIVLPFDYLVGDCFIMEKIRTGGFGSTGV